MTPDKQTDAEYRKMTEEHYSELLVGAESWAINMIVDADIKTQNDIHLLKQELVVYKDIERDIRLIGKNISCTTGGTFENHPLDAILYAAIQKQTFL